MKQAENYKNHPRRSWALNHMENPGLNQTRQFPFLSTESIQEGFQASR